ncbi:Phosphatidylglycerol lysyltransferase [Hartmannibacter diazotrophicus]|uniref:Phosphatidylglycerol lysyltransferase n=1 Tax=Hartmannibacter diazotrophicus TaxID=1482074 RepID=A0A2C9D236_9HYPH|nr:bifunctional lysylphosphatidylglycerol flippase/synthetase MprF [Hartmannibacter diazotrophicus]SON53565.1 Phosphatidylglycerol lysyltransferase [Hartmannibacter diazotrophicus]
MSSPSHDTSEPAPIVAGLHLPRLVPPLIGLVIAGLALFALEHLLAAVTLSDVTSALTTIAPQRIVLAILATTASFVALGLYDIVATRSVAPGKVPPHVAGAAGAAGYAVSNALGFPLLTGGALRWRIYAAEGLGAADIARIVTISWGALFTAIVTVISAALIIDPAGIRLWPWHDVRIEVAVGGVGLTLVAALLVFMATGPRRLRFGRLDLPLPEGASGSAYLAAGVADIIAAGAALYLLLPEGSTGSLAGFAVTYLVAILLGIASHAPGGLGVFEATIIGGLGLGETPEALAALLAYRLIYTFLPLVVAVAGIAVMELLHRFTGIEIAGRAVGRVLKPVVPPAMATVVFLGGIVLLVSGSTPALTDRIDLLSDVVPLPFVEASHLAASLVGAALLVVARGLYLRMTRAYVAAVGLLAAGAVFSLGKGLDWEEALVLTLTCAVLLVFRRAFYRRPREGAFHLSPRWLVMVTVTVAAITWLGFFAYREVDYQNALWWQFAFDSAVPRFLRTTVVLFAALALVGIDTLLVRRPERTPAPPVPEAVEALVAGSRDASAALALLGDKQFLVSRNSDAFVMYARSGGSLIALGDAVGNPEACVRLAWRFRELADQQGLRPIFYAVGAASLPRYLDMGLTALKLGEVARVDLQAFSLTGSARQELRYVDRRADKEGLALRVVPKDEVPAILPRLKVVSDEWLAAKGGTEKGFSLGSFDEDYLSAFDCAVLEKEGEIVAFANLWRGADKEEITIDLMRYVSGASKIIMDALFVKLMLAAKAEGYRWFNLGAAPLAGLVSHPLASRWNRLGALIYRRGGEVYHFEGLRAFKAKFLPEWTPHYLICPPGLDVPRALVDVTRLINSPRPRMKRAGGHPVKTTVTSRLMEVAL